MPRFGEILRISAAEKNDKAQSYGYFPSKDRVRAQVVVNENLRKIDMGVDPYRDLLFPAESPDFIAQGHYAISEKIPLELGGVGPCIGVVLLNERTGRSMIIHLEQRGDEDNIKEEARKFCSMIKELYASSPDRIVVDSLLLGTFKYHGAVIQELERIFKGKKVEKVMSPKIIVNPVLRKIEERSWEDLKNYDSLQPS